MTEQNIDPQPKFLNSCCNLFSIFFANFQKKVACKWSWKLLKAKKSSENNKKKLILNHFFNMMEQIIDPPT